MSRADILEKLKDILELATGKKVTEELDENASLTDDMGLSSVGILYIVVGIEEMFSIRFEDVGFADFKTLGDVVSYIEAKVTI